MAFPTVAAGTPAESITTITPVIGTHAAGSWLLAHIEVPTTAPLTPVGWDLLYSVPSTAGNTRICLYTRLATSSSETDPTFVVISDHIWGVVYVINGAHQTKPFSTSASFPPATSTAAIWPGVTTDSADNLLFYLLAWQIDNAGPIGSAEANATLANIAEVIDAGSALGNGGGGLSWTGEKATAGIVDPATATVTSTAMAVVTLAIQPPAVVASIGPTIWVEGM